MIEEVILGQMLDVDMTTGDESTEALLHKKTLYKSARYTFMRPMLTGAILAQTNKKNQDLIVQLCHPDIKLVHLFHLFG